MARFFNQCLESVTKWSKQYAHGKQIATAPSIELADWTAAYQWAREDKEINCKWLDDSTAEYYCPANDQTSVTAKEIKYVTDLQWSSFDLFRRRAFNVWIVTMDTSHWQSALCTCPHFLKQYKCKHSIGMALRLKLVKPPLEAKQIPIGQKRKRGRPKKAKLALLKD